MNKLVLIAVSMIFLGACANPDNKLQSERLADVIDSPLPGTGQTPNFAQPGDGTKLYPTTTGGSFSITKVYQTTLASNEIFKGFTATSEGRYMLVKRSVGGGIYWWDIYNAGFTSNFQLSCSILDNGELTSRIQKDGYRFYIYYESYSNPRFRVFSSTGCGELPSVYVSTSADSEGYSRSSSSLPYSVVNQKVYYLARQSYNKTRLKRYDLSNFSTSTISSQASHGGKDLEWAKTFAVGTDYVWTISHCETYPARRACIWKVSLETGAVIGWGQLPAGDYPDLEISDYGPDSVTLGLKDANTVLLTVQEDAVVKTFTLDVSGF